MPCNFYISHKAIASKASAISLGPVRVQEGKALRVLVLAKAPLPAKTVTVDCKIGAAEPEFTYKVGSITLDSSNLYLPAVPQTLASTTTVVLQEVSFPELDKPATWVEISASATGQLDVLGIFLLASGR